ncbi:transposase [Sphingomonas sp. TZW2008]|uniref:IS66 family transposase n=1 Tax=Sphingomonas sp. TZW2008 TaxID=1917973 RepID=UPI0015C4F5F8|nr:transposase [Sphingomonas sp. TZW2008]
MLFRYAPDRKAERPTEHLAQFRGDLHADDYAGSDRLCEEQIAAAACWAHVRRKLFDVHAATGSTTAREALDYIAGLFAVEQNARGRSPDERRCERQARPERC